MHTVPRGSPQPCPFGTIEKATFKLWHRVLYQYPKDGGIVRCGRSEFCLARSECDAVKLSGFDVGDYVEPTAGVLRKKLLNGDEILKDPRVDGS
jgi:hypothetical protein